MQDLIPCVELHHLLTLLRGIPHPAAESLSFGLRCRLRFPLATQKDPDDLLPVFRALVDLPHDPIGDRGPKEKRPVTGYELRVELSLK